MNGIRQTAGVKLGVPQAIHRAMSEALCCYLRDAVESGSLERGGTDSIEFRTGVMLYLLLCDHAVDRRGRCRSCRRPGAMLGQRRSKCRIHIKANFWLRQPDDMVLRHLANQLNHRPAPAPDTGGRPDRCHATRAAATRDPDTTQPLQTPEQARHVVPNAHTTETAPDAD